MLLKCFSICCKYSDNVKIGLKPNLNKLVQFSFFPFSLSLRLNNGFTDNHVHYTTNKTQLNLMKLKIHRSVRMARSLITSLWKKNIQILPNPKHPFFIPWFS